VHPKLKRLLINLGISLVATLLTLVVLELVARVVLPPPKFDPLLPAVPVHAPCLQRQFAGRCAGDPPLDQRMGHAGRFAAA
jgi:hypothetical protein